MTSKVLQIIDDQREALERALRFCDDPQAKDEISKAISANQTLEAILRGA